MAGNVVEVKDSDFEQVVLKSDVPVVVDFWAPWCGPCRMVAPVLEEVAKEDAGKVKVCKVNVDDEQESARRHGIMSIPTVMFFKDGEARNDLTLIGARPKGDYRKAIKALLE